jgi:hypothetical protein
MCRLRRPFLDDRSIHVSVKLLPSRDKLGERDYVGLAIALARIRQERFPDPALRAVKGCG